MPHSKTHLIPLQFEVLSWIAADCPEGVMVGISHRITARGLANRGLVTIDGHGPSWTAKITTAGSAALASANDPSDQVKAITEAQALLSAVVAAGGILPVEERPKHAVEIELIAAVLKDPARPVGKKLALYTVWGENPQWRLVDHFPDLVQVSAVPVPTSLRGAHPAVVAFQDNTQWQQVTKPHVHRAALILQAMAAEAERRGYGVSGRRTVKSNYERETEDSRADTHLVIRVEDHAYSLTIKEISAPGGGRLDYQAQSKLPMWMRRRQTAFISTGRLQLGLSREWNGRKHEFRDNSRNTLEDALPDLLREIEIRVLENRARRKAAELAESLKRSRWEQAMRDAETTLQYDHKADRLREQVIAWQEIQAIRGYVEAMSSVLDSLDAADRAGAELWIEWAQRHAARIDPLRQDLKVPSDRKFAPEDLQPYLGRLSPYGPSGR